MRASCSMFSQILELIPRIEFERMVKETGSEYASKGLSSWSQFVAMMFCRLGRAHGLREIEVLKSRHDPSETRIKSRGRPPGFGCFGQQRYLSSIARRTDYSLGRAACIPGTRAMPGSPQDFEAFPR